MKTTVGLFVAGIVGMVSGLFLFFVVAPGREIPAEVWMSYVGGVILCFGGVTLATKAFRRENALPTICVFLIGTALMCIGFWAFSWISRQTDVLGWFVILPVFSMLAGLLGAWIMDHALYSEEERKDLGSSFSDVVIVVLGGVIMVCLYSTPLAMLGYFWTVRSAMRLNYEIFP